MATDLLEASPLELLDGEKEFELKLYYSSGTHSFTWEATGSPNTPLVDR